jgi:asparaginyl-tRNA synthetase
MPSHISVSQISKYIGQEVTIKGWVYNRTDKGKLCFLLVRDGSGFIQCVAFKGDLQPETFDLLTHLPQESAVIITGAVREDKRAPGIPGGYELGVKQIEIVQEAGLDYPMSLKDHGPDFALDHRHLWIRMQSQWAILRVRAAIMAATRAWLDSNGFFEMSTPILTPAAAEGTTTLLKLNTLMKEKPISRRRVNSTTKPTSSRSGKSTVSAPPSAPRNRRRGVTSPNSGCSNLRSPSATWMA